MNVVLSTDELDVVRRAFERFPELARQELRTAMHAATLYLQKEVVERTPAAEGVLRGSIHPFVQELPGGMLGVVGTAKAYAEAVELGTKPHMPPIEPLEQWVRTKLGKSGKEGASIARRIQWHIFHYGTPGAGMFHRGLTAGLAEVQRVFGDALQRLRARLAEGGR